MQEQDKVFDDAELDKESVVRNFRITATDDKLYDVMYYSLQTIIAVDYDKKAKSTKMFYAAVQNKMQYAIANYLFKILIFGGKEHD